MANLFATQITYAPNAGAQSAGAIAGSLFVPALIPWAAWKYTWVRVLVIGYLVLSALSMTAIFVFTALSAKN